MNDSALSLLNILYCTSNSKYLSVCEASTLVLDSLMTVLVRQSTWGLLTQNVTVITVKKQDSLNCPVFSKERMHC